MSEFIQTQNTEITSLYIVLEGQIEKGVTYDENDIHKK